MIKTLLFLTALGLVQAVEIEKSLKEPHPDCPEHAHYLLPHEYDCTKFYYCEGGEKFIAARDCPPGTEFSSALQVCIHPELADCNLPGAPSETTQAESTSTTQAASTTSPTTTTTQANTGTPGEIETTESTTTQASTTASTTTQASTTASTTTQATTQNPDSGTTDCETFDNGCPVDFDIHMLLPHETSCRKFYYCVRGEKVLTSCSRGTVFNPAIQRCDHPENLDRTCEDEDSSEEVPDVEDDKSEEEIELLPNGCPVDFSISMYLPHEYYCNKYYQCVFGEKVDRRCGPGTHFNYDIQACDHIENVGCTLPGGDASEQVTTTTSTTERPSIDFDENGCPVDGMIHWLLPHEDDCTKFYYCVWGGKVEASCSGGLHFNAQTQQCDNPATAGCLPCDKESAECSETPESEESRELFPDIEEEDTEETEVEGPGPENNSSSEEDLPIGEDAPEDTPVDTPEDTPEDDCVEEPGQGSEQDKKCEEECNIRPWAHEDCDKYWTCEGQKAVLVVCTEGLQFNPSTYTCDFACNSGCVRTNVQATAGYEGLKLFLPWNKIDENTKHLLKLVAN